jgi:hypothetical protein
VQLDDLEAVGEPVCPLLSSQRPAHLVVPPLAGLRQVAVAESEERVVVGEGGDGPEVAPVHVRAHVATAARQQVGRVAHGQAIDMDHVVEAPGEVGWTPGHDAGHAVLLSTDSVWVHPITPGSPVTRTTAKRANSSSAYHRSVGARSITRRWSG